MLAKIIELSKFDKQSAGLKGQNYLKHLSLSENLLHELSN